MNNNRTTDRKICRKGNQARTTLNERPEPQARPPLLIESLTLSISSLNFRQTSKRSSRKSEKGEAIVDDEATRGEMRDSLDSVVWPGRRCRSRRPRKPSCCNVLQLAGRGATALGSARLCLVTGVVDGSMLPSVGLSSGVLVSRGSVFALKELP